MVEGQIIEIISDLHVVSFNKQKYRCKCRGVFRKKNILPLVGDYCLFDREKLVIEKILPRKNELVRPKVSNIDQGIIVISLVNPDFSINLLDRFLVILEVNMIKPIICITKLDLVSFEDFRRIDNILNYYRNLGYLIFTNQELDDIKDLLRGKTTVFTGQTGAGKSTLLNKIDNDLHLRVGEVSQALGRGKHTTRVVSLYEVCDGKVLDTPGFSLIDFNYSNEKVKGAFIEFNNYNCYYKDCSHTNERECLVKKAVLDGSILKERYDDYLKFIKR